MTLTERLEMWAFTRWQLRRFDQERGYCYPRWWRARRARRAVAERPTGVRVAHADGTETPIELAYRGRNEHGEHEWEAMTPVNFRQGDRLKADTIPGRTAIRFPTEDR